MLTLNGLNTFDGRLTFPRTGVWHADVRVDTPGEITGAVTLNLDEGKMLMAGTVARGGNWQDTGVLRVVGGAGGLRRIAKPKHYDSASVRVVLGDLLATAGETLSSTADATVLARPLDAWTTAALPIGRLITQLLLSAYPTATWRVLPDGTVWVGREGWPDSGLTEDDYQVLAEDPSRAEAVIGMETPLLMPGTRLGTRRVSYVEHQLTEKTRTSVWFETGGPDGRLKTALRGVVKASQAPIDYFCHYFAKVVSQSGDSIDVKPLDSRIPSMAAVPLFLGVPKWKVIVPAGGLVLVGWSGGDPARPYVHAFGAAGSASFLGLLADKVTVGVEQSAQPSILGTAYRSAEATMNGVLVTNFMALAAAATGPLAPLAAAFTAMAAAIQTFEASAASYLSQQVRSS